MDQADPLMAELQAAISVAQTGDHSGARRLFDDLLPRIGDDAAKNCILAHYMADLQDSVEDELAWDLRSLQHLERITQTEIDVLGTPLKTAGFYASVYLNVANDYKKLGDRERLARYLELAEASCDDLGDDQYGAFVRGRIALLRKNA